MTSYRNVRLNVRELPTAFADRAMLHQVFTNYLANAVKFTSTRENAVIDIEGWSDLRENIYYVRDNGIGFEIKDAENIFGIFQRLHQQPEFKGTGVGLSIVQRILIRDGGRVWAEGEPGRGCGFYFSLPIKEAGPDREVRPEGG
jgi:two-component system sensor kinase